MSNNSRSKQTTIVRGICAVLQGMAMPTMQNLDDELRKFGYTIIKLSGEKVGEQREKNYNQQ